MIFIMTLVLVLPLCAGLVSRALLLVHLILFMPAYCFCLNIESISFLKR